MSHFLLALVLACLSFNLYAEQFTRFASAKKHLIKTLPENATSLYCGCDIKRQGKKLVPDPTACGYVPRNAVTRSGKPNARATRIEWEHIVPAWEFGHQLQCWQDGGRKNCIKTSAQFRKMEADINNLAPAIGEINADRSNYRFGMITGDANQYGRCQVKVDFKQRVVEPPFYARKRIADAYFYMQKTYGLKISDKQQKLFNAWQNQALAAQQSNKAL
ncbi:endonuclease [Pseudoalteromonas haloplanktis]|uniref:Endonuclease n=1 Tax=Pseudoalteromonas haloplanktis TaxID=228 RepID=A0ABU1BD91_PSEHA|nr:MULTISPECIES: endonuclease [Pseudoalteromonas]MDQ9092463.1 endonuclease [Pseudoalteromonas haloplanktis]BDF95799.1 endonuclease [Pseudoalteromonas sp. KAN5]